MVKFAPVVLGLGLLSVLFEHFYAQDPDEPYIEVSEAGFEKDDQASGAYHVRIFMKNARAHPAKDVRRVLVATPASLDGDPIWPVEKKGPLAETLRQGVLFTAQSLDVDGRHDQEKGRRQPPGSIRVLGVDKDG